MQPTSLQADGAKWAMPVINKLRRVRQKLREWQQPDLVSLCDTIIARRLSFLEKQALFELAVAAQACRHLQGHAVECGTALGGSAIAILAGLGSGKHLALHDVFGLIPPPSDKDTEAERQRYEVISSGAASGFGADPYYGYEPDLPAKISGNIASVLGEPALLQVAFHKGLFSETLNSGEPLCFVHLDGDWYDSTMSAVERTWPRLVQGGVMVVDDYYAWEGCRKAINDYFRDRTGFSRSRQARLHIRKQ
jgi:predicted O-methyltransferase YrrM